MAVTHDDINRSLGRVEGSQSALEKRMDRIEKLVSDGFDDLHEALAAINSRLAAIEEAESRRKGAWKVFATIGSVISAAIGAVAAWALRVMG